MLEDSLSVHGLLRQETGGGKHGKATVLKLLRYHHVQLLGIFRPQAKGIKSNIAGVVVVAKKSGLIVGGVGGVDPANLRALRLSGSNEGDDDGVPSAGHLQEVGDGRSGDLAFEEGGDSLDCLADQESENGEHGDAAVGDLGLAVALQGLLVGLGGEAERIEESHRSEGAGHAVDGEGAHCGGGPGNWCGCECGGGADESGGEDKLHHVCCCCMEMMGQ